MKSILRLWSLAAVFAVLMTVLLLNVRLSNKTNKIEVRSSARLSTSNQTQSWEVTSAETSTDIGQPTASTQPTPPVSRLRNVLFIIVDDLRPQIGPYFDPEHPDYFSRLKIHTPNLDRLASESIVFRRAYAQYSLCGPSRASLLTGRRPDVTRVYTNKDYWRRTGGNFTTLPQHFKDNGYMTVGVSKVFHPGLSSDYDDPISWSEPYQWPRLTDRLFLPPGSVGTWSVVPDSASEQAPLLDIGSTRTAKQILTNVSGKADGPPFFLAVGYFKPHVSFVCPQKYYDMYPLEEEDFLADAAWRTPSIRLYDRMEGMQVKDDGFVLPSDVLRQLRRGYFACVSYVDELIGEMLRHLEELGLAKNTVVSLMADHGYHLGENRKWGKVTTNEMANRVPLMIRIPGLTDAGMTSSSIVESVDVFPTLVEAAGLDAVPPCPRHSSDVRLCTEGVSLMPLVGDPDGVVKDAAFSQVKDGKGMFYVITTKRFRLVDRAHIVNKRLPHRRRRRSAQWPPDVAATELYDLTNDVLERRNLVSDSRYADIINNLRQKLHAHVDSNLR